MKKSEIRLMAAFAHPYPRFISGPDQDSRDLVLEDIDKQRDEYIADMTHSIEDGLLVFPSENAHLAHLLYDAAQRLRKAETAYRSVVAYVTSMARGPLPVVYAADHADSNRPAITKIMSDPSSVQAAIDNIMSVFGNELRALGITDESDSEEIAMALGLIIVRDKDEVFSSPHAMEPGEVIDFEGDR